MIDYIYKDLFLKDSIPKQVTISFDNVVLTNEDLYNQEMTLEESLCSEKELRFGCCEASVLKFKISDIFTPMIGKWLDVKMVINGNSDEPFPIGKYKVDSDKPSSDRKYREIVAYDIMHDIINSSAIDWYNTIFPNSQTRVPMRIFRQSFVEYFGLKQVDPVKYVKKDGTLVYGLINDDMYLSKTIQVVEGTEIDNETEQVSVLKESSLSGKDIINAICEINGCFGHIGRDGKFHYIYLQQDIMGLYPRKNLFPDHAPDYLLRQQETGHLYPQEPNSTRIGPENYISSDYENFISKKINKVQIRQEENDIGGQFPKEKIDNENRYIIEGNFLVYGKKEEELHQIAKNIFDKITNVIYRPFSAECVGNPCLEVGDSVRFSTKYEIIESYILKRTLKGIQALRDSLSADGVEKYSEKLNGVNSSILQLRGKTNTLIRNVDETVSELKDLESNTESRFTQTAETIKAEVKRASDAEGELSSSIKIEADRITSEVSKREEGQNELSSRIEQAASSIVLSVDNGEKTAGIHISLKNENGDEIDSKDGNIAMTGLVTFRNLTGEEGETRINGGLIETESIDASKIKVSTLYLEDKLRLRHTNPDGTFTQRTALWMEDVSGQTYPNVVLGSKNSTANVVVKNEFTCEGGALIEESLNILKDIIVFGEANIEKNLNVSKNVSVAGEVQTIRVSLDATGAIRGIRTIGKDESTHYIMAVQADDVTTLVGLPNNKDHQTTTLLRGNVVKLDSAGSVTPSDERLKNSFKTLDEFDEVYMDIEPCAFKYNNGTSGRYHFGTKAGDVKYAFEKHGYTTKDFGGFVQMEDNPENENYCGLDDPMGLIYTEFTMWNMHMIQNLFKKIEKQQGEISDLKNIIERMVVDE